MDQGINEKSWEQTIFHEPNLFSTVQGWLFHAKPSKCIDTEGNHCKSIVVLNPKLKAAKYRKTYHREGDGVPDDVKREISLNGNTMSRDQLLIKAGMCSIYQGFWFISCKKEISWDYYFEKIAGHMYDNVSNKTEGYDQFLKVEACWNSSQDMGVVMLSNCFFDNVKLINKFGGIIRALINGVDVTNGNVSPWLSYKPQFYFDSGFDVNFTHDPNKNMYIIDLMSNQGS